MTSINYSIAPSDMAFHALTTSLYKDRLRAPIREVLSNAIDIQRRTGNETPIEIKLPTVLDSQFRIRDFGTGLSKADMQRLYSSLFSSDKHLQKDNEVGGFGVGAKSPFAYTDAFTVESYHGGTRTIYSAFMDGNAAPQLLELFQEESTEPSGLAVSYPVEKADEQELIKMVAQEVFYCGHPVQCLGGGDLAEPLESSKDFEHIDNMWLGENREIFKDTFYVRMGNVVYPLPKDHLFAGELGLLQKMVNTVRRQHRREMEDHFMGRDHNEERSNWRTLILDVPIGSVRPAMSREELVLGDELTLQGLKTAFGVALRGLYKHTLEQGTLAQCMDLWHLYQTSILDKTPSRRNVYDDYYEYRDAYEDDRHQKAPTLTASDREGCANVLQLEYRQLEARVAEKVARDELWQHTALEIHPGLVHSLSSGRFSGMLSEMGRRRPGMGHDKYEDMHMISSGFRPVLEGTRETPDIWNESGTIFVIPHQTYSQSSKNPVTSHVSVTSNTSSELFDSVLAEIDNHPFGRRHASKSKNSATSDPRLGRRVLRQFIETIASSENSYVSSGGYRASAPVLVFATSHAHEQALLRLASESNKPLHMLDLAKQTIKKIEPVSVTAQAAAPTGAGTTNPYATPASKDRTIVENMTSVKASYWDMSTNALVHVTLEGLPEYWIAKRTKHEGPSIERLLQQSQPIWGDLSPLYMLDCTALSEKPTKAWCSETIQDKCIQLMAEYSPPKTKTDWLLANLALPQEHPLYNDSTKKYMDRAIVVNMLRKEQNTGHRYEDTKRATIVLPVLQFEKPTLFEIAFEKRYPLIQAFASNTHAISYSAPISKEHAQALFMYMQLVDQKHPDFGPDLLASTSTPSLG